MKIFNDCIFYLKKVRTIYSFTYYISLGLLLLGIAMLTLSFFDDRMVNGVNTWYKPFKFSWSIGIYLLTMPFFIGNLQLNEALKRKVISGLCIVMTLEFILIFIQAARSVPSHYNTSTTVDLWIFNSMGLCIALMTLIMIVLTSLYLFSPPKIGFTTWQLRLLQFGLFLFIFSCAVGGRMIGNSHHAIGSSNTEYLIPLLGWHTKSGDLRIPHFFGIHALQIFPIIALYLKKWSGLLFGLFYGFLVFYLFYLAMKGQSLF